MRIVHFCGPKLALLSKDELKKELDMVNGLEQGIPLMGVSENGIKLDFNMGLRLRIPKGTYHVKIWDSSSNIVFFDNDISDVVIISAEKFFVKWEVEVCTGDLKVFYHRYNAKDKNVLFSYPISGMGDRIVLFPYMESFRVFHGCQAYYQIENDMQELLKLYYPDAKTLDAATNIDLYATYYLAPTFYNIFSSEEIRTLPMEYLGRELLGIEHGIKKKFFPTSPRIIDEPYVCIAVQASNTSKTWLNPYGWDMVVEYLQSIGYRVLCIDKDREQTDHGNTVRMPINAEDFTGAHPLSQRINILAYADFFIGLSSGLSWLANAVGIPVIMISGITAPWFEFDNPYRVINRLVCHGCHNDVKVPWPKFEYCPYKDNYKDKYECSKKISAMQVIEKINQLLMRKEDSEV